MRSHTDSHTSSASSLRSIVGSLTVGVAMANPAPGAVAIAGAAGLAAGALTRDDLDRWVQPGPPVTPDAATRAEYDRLYGLYRALYPATRDIVHAL